MHVKGRLFFSQILVCEINCAHLLLGFITHVNNNSAIWTVFFQSIYPATIPLLSLSKI